MPRVSNSPPQTARPPLKIQGGKTRLVPFLRQHLPYHPDSQRWVEPFLGSGAVLLNFMPNKALIGDTNPHTIALYRALQSGAVDVGHIAEHLDHESELLRKQGEAHYYAVRKRFNVTPSPLDLVFLNHTCFNGLVRFNRRGEFNSPFCRNSERLTPSLVADIAGRLSYLQQASQSNAWDFRLQDWRVTLSGATPSDFVYADPPYAGRHTTYYKGWGEHDAHELAGALRTLPCPWALSDWASDAMGPNPRLQRLYAGHEVRTREHSYVIGAKGASRGRMTEALVLSSESSSGPPGALQSLSPAIRGESRSALPVVPGASVL